MIQLSFLLFIPLIASRSIDHGLEIYNGEDAGPDDFPYMVSIHHKGAHICGGTLISPLWVLTAAHCLSGCPTSYTVVYKSLDSFHNVSVPSDHLSKISRYIIHDKFKLGFTTHDIGLIELAKYINLPNYSQLSNIPINAYENATVAGWGYTNRKIKEPTRKLQKTNLMVYSIKQCNETAFDETTQMCAGSAVGRTCPADSGGPLVYKGVQYGIVSIGNKDCTTDNPVFFTKIVALKSWIWQHTQT